jgi:hypothetical protein
MTRFDIAHIREQGVDMIIVPLDQSFDYQSDAEKHAAIRDLQMRCRGAGLAGTVVPVWLNAIGTMMFIAPRPWHAFFQSITWAWIGMNINRSLSW